MIESIKSALAGRTADLSIFVATTTTTFFATFGPQTRCLVHGHTMTLAGSGTKHFQQVLNELNEKHRAEEMEDGQRYMTIVQGLAGAAAVALVAEAQNMGTLEEHYGGGFELILREEDESGKSKLRKVPMTTVFWRTRRGAKGIELGISMIIQQFYSGEDLYYRAIHLNSEVRPAGCKPRRGGIYIPYQDSPGLVHKLIKVEPIIRIAPADPVPILDDNTPERIYTHIILENEELATAASTAACVTNVTPETPMYFEIEQMQHGVDLRYSPLFLEDLKLSVKYPDL
ncbi:hypothetical protein [Bradyrhizobium sp. 2S1]|uniref:hypothetical protein n=1 Tax=Bradyrhizobium sp. 2S1 TaxID=1404429 RepID=UPI00140E1841|nr:hypothetical protein [Bradyrhizobium sp. 2S1]MCK7670149.1 hypothetical protein [Bradyrhizobium sp. 2S1]